MMIPTYRSALQRAKKLSENGDIYFVVVWRDGFEVMNDSEYTEENVYGSLEQRCVAVCEYGEQIE